MQLVIFEDAGFSNLLPLVYSRATFNLRCGFDNLLDKIETVFGQTAAALFVRESIAPAIAERQGRPVNTLPGGDSQLWINGRLFVRERFEMPPNTAAWKGDTLLAASIDAATAAR
ncbi:MAG: putative sugar nucleotidyl transferase, partial [Phycisphaerae bacterium]